MDGLLFRNTRNRKENTNDKGIGRRSEGAVVVVEVVAVVFVAVVVLLVVLGI